MHTNTLVWKFLQTDCMFLSRNKSKTRYVYFGILFVL